MHFSLFGQFRASGGQSLQKLHRRPRSQSLIAYLILAGGVASRARLAEVLWPNSSGSQARTNLRRELHVLKSEVVELSHCLVISPDTVELLLTDAVTTDTQQFDEYYDRFKVVDDNIEKISVGQHLLDICSSRLLPELNEDWIDPHRQRYFQSWHLVAEFVADQYFRSSDFERAQQIVRRRLLEDQLNESAMYQLLTMLSAQNMHAEAVKEYQRFEVLCLQELGIRPNSLLIDLTKLAQGSLANNNADSSGKTNAVRYDEKLDSSNHASIDLEFGRPALSSVLSPFVGRSQSIDWLRSTLSESDQSQSELVLVSGESGIGKSRLIHEYLTLAESNTTEIPMSRCSHTNAQIPFSTVADWLHCENLASKIRLLDQVHQNELRSVFPACFKFHVENSNLSQERPGVFRGHSLLFEALAELIALLDESCVLLIDDIQWCDRDSLSFIEHLFESPAVKNRIIACLRIEELSVLQPLVDCLDRLEAKDQLLQLNLAPLSSNDCSQLFLDYCAHTQVPASTQQLVELICLRSEGNPLYLTEMVRYLLSGGSIDSVSSSDFVPKKIHAILRQRLSSLSEDAKSIARTAAVCGYSFNGELIRLATGLSEETAVDAFEELFARHILQEQLGNRCEFCHECIREVVRQGTSEARTRFINNKIAIAYESLYASLPDEFAGVIANHFEKAGLGNEAFCWYEQAMTIAEERLAYHECLALYEKASSHLGGSSVSHRNADRRAEIMLRQANIHALLYGYAAESVRGLCRELERLRPHLQETENIMQLLNRLRMLASFSGECETAIKIAKQAVQEANRIGDVKEQIEAYRSMAFAEYSAGHLRRAVTTIRRGIAVGNAAIKNGILDPYDVPWSYPSALYMQAHFTAARGMFDVCRKSLKSGDSIATSNVSLNMKVYIQLPNAIALFVMREKSATFRSAEKLVAIAKKCDAPKAMIFANAFGGWAEPSAVEGIKRIQIAITEYTHLVEDHFMPFWQLMLAERQIDNSENDTALVSVRLGLSVAVRSSAQFLLPELQRMEARAMQACSMEYDLIVACYDEAIESARMQGARLYSLRSLNDKIMYCNAMGSATPDGTVQHEDKAIALEALLIEARNVQKHGECADLAVSMKLLEKHGMVLVEN